MEVLRLGSRGPEVELLQKALMNAGVFDGTIDGVFGNVTYRALVSFQTMFDLTPDGILGPKTYSYLHRYLTGYVEHVISLGDTLFRLASIYQTTIDAILVANPSINPYQLMINQVITVPLGFPVVFTDISYSSTALDYAVEGLLKRYPVLRVDSVGHSVLGKELVAIKIGSGIKHLGVNASHHANEWITTPIVMKFLEDICLGYYFSSGSGGINFEELFRKVTLTIIPMVNPDGVDLVTGLISPESVIYQEVNELSLVPNFPLNWKANIRGVDINVNYPAGWLEAREAKKSQGIVGPGPRDYVGPVPLSEPETVAMASYSINNRFDMTLSYHTQGEVIFWDFLQMAPPESYEIGQILSKASGYGLSVIEGSYAGYKDWFIQTFYAPGYTVEAGRGVNPLPISDFPLLYPHNKELILAALEVVKSM